MSISSLPTISDAQLPADVRRAGTQAKSDFKTALSFETMLVGQLVKEMTPKDGPMAEGPYASTMQDTLSTALVGGHGLGLAQQLYKEMRS
jgi:Rod binding domain-containing protein